MIAATGHHGKAADHRLARTFRRQGSPSARRYAALGHDRPSQPSKPADDASISIDTTNLNPPSQKAHTQISDNPWRKIRTNYPLERILREIHRGTRLSTMYRSMKGIFLCRQGFAEKPMLFRRQGFSVRSPLVAGCASQEAASSRLEVAPAMRRGERGGARRRAAARRSWRVAPPTQPVDGKPKVPWAVFTLKKP